MTTEQNIEEILRNNLKAALAIYKESAYDKDEIPLLCEIHNAFGGIDGVHHNCLGCNFADSQNMIYHFLSKYEQYSDIQESITLYILTLYLLVERIEIIMDMVQLPEAYREKHFKVFQQIRKWSNFIKHPKAFILTHHPQYDFNNSGIDFGKEFSIVINDQFVTEYYKGESDPAKNKSKNKDLYNKLKNQRDIQVVFPDCIQLTEKLGYSIKMFKDLILDNKVYKEILNDDTTISNYFENQQGEKE